MYNDAILYPALAAPAVTGSFTASFAPGAPKLGLSFDPSDVTSMVAIKVDPEGQAFAAGARVGCTILSVGDAVDLQGVGDFRDAVRRYQADPSLPCVVTFSTPGAGGGAAAGGAGGGSGAAGGAGVGGALALAGTGSFAASFATGAPKLGISFDPDRPASLIVAKVDPEGQAFAAGLRPGCLILSVGDAAGLKAVGDFRDAVRRYQADPSLPCVVTFTSLPDIGPGGAAVAAAAANPTAATALVVKPPAAPLAKAPVAAAAAAKLGRGKPAAERGGREGRAAQNWASGMSAASLVSNRAKQKAAAEKGREKEHAVEEAWAAAALAKALKADGLLREIEYPVMKVKNKRLQLRLLRLTPRYVYHIEEDVGLIKTHKEKVRKWVSWPEVQYVSIHKGTSHGAETEIKVHFQNQTAQHYVSEFSEDIANYMFRHLARLRNWDDNKVRDCANANLFGQGGGGKPLNKADDEATMGGGGSTAVVVRPAAGTAAGPGADAGAGGASSASGFNAEGAAFSSWVPRAPLLRAKDENTGLSGPAVLGGGGGMAPGGRGNKAVVNLARRKTANSMIEGRIKALTRTILANAKDNVVAQLVASFVGGFETPKTDGGKAEALRSVRNFMSTATFMLLERHGRELGALLASIDAAAGLDNSSVLRAVTYTCETAIYPRIEAKVLACLERDAEEDEAMRDRMDALSRKPQSFFGIPPHLRSPRGYAKALDKLRFLESGSLPTAKIEAIRETALAILDEVAGLKADAQAEFDGWAAKRAELQRLNDLAASQAATRVDTAAAAAAAAAPKRAVHVTGGRSSGRIVRDPGSGGGGGGSLGAPAAFVPGGLWAGDEHGPPDPALLFGGGSGEAADVTPEQLLGILTFVVVQADLEKPLQMRTLVWSLADPSLLKGSRGYYCSLFELSLVYIAGRSIAVINEEDFLLPRSFEPEEYSDDEDDALLGVPPTLGTLGAGGLPASFNAPTTLNTLSRLTTALKTSALAGGRAPSVIGARPRAGSYGGEADAATELSRALKRNAAVVLVKPHLVSTAQSASGASGASADKASAAASSAAGALVRALLEGFSDKGLVVTREGTLSARELADRVATSSASNASAWPILPDQRGVAVGAGGLPYFIVEFGEDECSWQHFNDVVVGSASVEPSACREGSVRRRLAELARTELKHLPAGHAFSRANSGVHASSGPLAAYAERLEWLKEPKAALAPFEGLLRATGAEYTAKRWLRNPLLAVERSLLASSPQRAPSSFSPAPGGGGGGALLSSQLAALLALPATASFAALIAADKASGGGGGLGSPALASQASGKLQAPTLALEAGPQADGDNGGRGGVGVGGGGGGGGKAKRGVGRAAQQLRIASSGAAEAMAAVDSLPMDLARQTVLPLGPDDDALAGPGMAFGRPLSLTSGLDTSGLVRLCAGSHHTNYALLVVKAAFPVQDSDLADNEGAFARVEACVKEVLRATAGLEVIPADGAHRGSAGSGAGGGAVATRAAEKSTRFKGGGGGGGGGGGTNNPLAVEGGGAQSDDEGGDRVGEENDLLAPVVLTGEDVRTEKLFSTVHRVSCQRAVTPVKVQWPSKVSEGERLDPVMRSKVEKHKNAQNASRAVDLEVLRQEKAAAAKRAEDEAVKAAAAAAKAKRKAGDISRWALGDDGDERFKRLFGVPVYEAAATGLMLSAKEVMDTYVDFHHSPFERRGKRRRRRRRRRKRGGGRRKALTSNLVACASLSSSQSFDLLKLRARGNMA